MWGKNHKEGEYKVKERAKQKLKYRKKKGTRITKG